MNNELRLGYNRRALTQSALTDGTNWAQTFGIPNVGTSFPNFNIGYGLSALGDYKNVGDDITLQDNVTKILGRHTIKTGYELIRTRYDATVLTSPGGTYTFGGTEQPFTPNTGNTFASFLLGTVSSATFTQSLGSWLPRWSSHQAYVQDDWRPLSNLSVNLGVRWSYETPFHTKYGQQSQFDPNAIDPVTGLKGAITHPTGNLARSDWNNFAPRIGLSWNFRPKFVFRSSFGIVHVDIFAVTQNIMFDEYVATATVAANPGDPNYAFKLSDGPPAVKYNIQANGSAPFVGTNYSTRPASWFDPNMRMPYVMNWSGGVQYEFARNWLVELLYQGQSGVGLINNWNLNTIPLNISTDPTTLNNIYAKAQNYVPYPQFGAINLYSNFSHNTYHGGTVRVERRFTSGLAFNAFYTYSKTLTDVSSEGTATGVTYYNRSLEKGRADYDMRHHFVSVLDLRTPLRSRPSLYEPWRHSEPDTRRLGTGLDPNSSIRPTLQRHLYRQPQQIPARQWRGTAQHRYYQRPGPGQRLVHRSEPLPHLRPEPVLEQQFLRLPRRLHRRHAGPQHIRGPRHELHPAVAFQVVDPQRKIPFPGPLGRL